LCIDEPVFTGDQLKEVKGEFGISKRDFEGKKVPLKWTFVTGLSIRRGPFKQLQTTTIFWNVNPNGVEAIYKGGLELQRATESRSSDDCW